MVSLRRPYLLYYPPMTSTTDIYKFAEYEFAEAMIKKHGNDAVAICKERANKFYDRGDDEGSTFWTRIAKAVEDLQRPEPEFGEDIQ